MPKDIDIALIQFPNKTIEIPPLGTSVLTAYIKDSGYSCKQYDFNILIKDEFINKRNLKFTLDEVLPFLLDINMGNSMAYNKLGLLHDLLLSIDQEYSLAELCSVKRMLQVRDYESVFCDTRWSQLFNKLLHLLTLSNEFFNIMVSNPNIEKYLPEYFLYKTVDRWLETVLDLNPQIIGISIVEMQRQFSIWAIDRLRGNHGFDGLILVGGSDVTYYKSEYLKHYPNIDLAICQEGEIAVVKLLETITTGRNDYSEVPNLIYRHENNIVENQKQFLEDFNQISPTFDDLPLGKYISEAIPVQASRGCSWAKCTYCKHFRTYGKDYYESAPHYLIDQISLLKNKYNTSLFHFVDDDMPLHLKNTLAEMLIDKKIDIKWLAYSRFDRKITSEMLRKWHESGLYVLEWGVESASQTVLKSVKKGTTIETIQRLLWDSYSVGILNKVFMFHNLPSENYEDLWQSIMFLKTYVLQGIVRPFWEILTPLELLVDTPLYNESVNGSVNDNKYFKKVFLPRGTFVAQASYLSNQNYEIKKTMLADSLQEVKALCIKENILEVNDEAIMFDIILEELRLEGKELKLNTRLSMLEQRQSS